MFIFGKLKKARELKRLYAVAQAESEEFANILYLLHEHKVKTFWELIHKYPRVAYVNGIVNSYNGEKNISKVESKELAEKYFNFEIACVEEILNDIKEQDGDYEGARETMRGILNYCNDNRIHSKGKCV